jgi:2-amino-4-hydroxy-6-hydroxymethyldihydropteridine diphosphokinase
VTRAYVGMGSNLGDRVAALAAALRALEAVPGIGVAAVSRVYESEPWGIADQPAFANAVAALDTTLTAEDLLAVFKRLESEAGRAAGARFGPRPLDLDLLLYGSEAFSGPALTVPHPRLLARDFVVTPLLELAPRATLPDGTPVTRAAATDGRVTGVLATLWTGRA